MSARILDGHAVAEEIRREIRADVDALKKAGVTPGLGVVLVGDNPASRSYVSAKERACSDVGVFSREAFLGAKASEADILSAVRGFNDDPLIHGILVQLPLPDGKMEDAVLSAVDPAKDIDGFHPINVGQMVLGLPTFLPCTPHGIVQLLKRSGLRTEGAHVVVIGRSRVVGRPLSILLSQKSAAGNATVTLCHSATRNLSSLTSLADMVIVAAGHPRTLTADMIREGAVVIDVGVNRIKDTSRDTGYRLTGDVDFDRVKEKASAITPVPGGVGPMTIAMLLHNTVLAARRQSGHRV